jgi:hypothetical protein
MVYRIDDRRTTQEIATFNPDAYPELFLEAAQDRIRDLQNQRALDQLRRTRRQARRARVRGLLTGQAVRSRA